ncbi:hypothetical protein LCGC14_0315870 [marine sediment metagenome]|uniref:Ice-binding protein C-terminal domain-containing protein n=1 Tax=marine sediment metagenome TaxID=412755 RepID=A0A0F9W852_9ZZZZ|nr:LamG domain-containing protein [Phycisphaerae bacterium]HDZ44127.1 LamG domain-containing protein [Phycisphaerae bacterium]
MCDRNIFRLSATVMLAMAVVVVSTSPVFAVDPNGLVAYWPLDGSAVDQGPNSLDGTPLNGVGFGDGILGNGLHLDGADDYVNVTDAGAFPSIIGGLSQGSISVWFKFDRITTQWEIFPIFYMGDGVGGAGQTSAIIEIGHPQAGDTKLYWTTYRDDQQNEPTMCFDTNFNLSAGEWYQFTVVVSPSGNTGYLNGQELVDRDYNFADATSPEFLEDISVQQVTWIGRGFLAFSPADQYFPGEIDEVVIYDRPLSATEVLDYYNATVPEPASITLLLLGAGGLIRRRRRN